MAAFASCKFPALNKWKKAADNNIILEFIDSVISGYSQIIFNDNTFTGILFIIGIFIGSIEHGIMSLVGAITSTLVSHFIGIGRADIRSGVYTFNGTLTGLGVVTFIFAGQGLSPWMFGLTIAGAIICVYLTAGLIGFLSKFNLPILVIPFCFTMALLVPASLRFPTMGATTTVIPYFNEFAAAEPFNWTIQSFLSAVINSFSEILLQSNVISGSLILIGLLMASRVDVLGGLLAAALANCLAIYLGLPGSGIEIGLYSFNSVLVMVLLFGRGYRMSVKSFIFALVIAIITVIVSAWILSFMAPLGIPIVAFPFVTVATLGLLGREFYSSLKPIECSMWGVPETIEKEFKNREKVS